MGTACSSVCQECGIKVYHLNLHIANAYGSITLTQTPAGLSPTYMVRSSHPQYSTTVLCTFLRIDGSAWNHPTSPTPDIRTRSSQNPSTDFRSRHAGNVDKSPSPILAMRGKYEFIHALVYYVVTQCTTVPTPSNEVL